MKLTIPCNRNSEVEGTDRLISDQELSDLLGRSVQTLRNDRCHSRGLPYVRLGRSIRYRLSDIEKYLEGHRIIPGE